MPVNVRIMAATHRDLAAMVAAGAFRQDLFFRLNILRIDMPTLRERRDDIWLLAQNLYQRVRQNLGLAGEPPLPEALRDALLAHDWPGNIRELENVLERLAVFLAEMPETPLDPEVRRILADVAPELTRGAAHSEPGDLASHGRRQQAAHVREVLTRCGGDRRKACEQLGISPTTLWRWLRTGA